MEQTVTVKVRKKREIKPRTKFQEYQRLVNKVVVTLRSEYVGESSVLLKEAGELISKLFPDYSSCDGVEPSVAGGPGVEEPPKQPQPTPSP